jgi:hypothetical protein
MPFISCSSLSSIFMWSFLRREGQQQSGKPMLAAAWATAENVRHALPCMLADALEQ